MADEIKPTDLDEVIQRFNGVVEDMATVVRARIERAAATSKVLRSVRVERDRQDERWGEQNHPDSLDQTLTWAAGHNADDMKTANARLVVEGALDWSHILLEEVWEALGETEPVNLRAELVQVAAVAVCWIECIDRREVAERGES